MEHEEISKKLDRLNADLARLEDSISTIYEEVLRLRVDVSGVQSRIKDWRVVTSSWVPPMPD
jgi:predicted  nucleic acid-binding Zn-ribbon protein